MTAANHSVVVLTYDGLCTFEFGIAVEVFGLKRPEFDFPWYTFSVAAAESKRVAATGGIVIEADKNLTALENAGTIVIPGWRDQNEKPPKNMLDAIKSAHKNGTRIMSICSGAFVLAAAGVLDEKRATTHWRYFDNFKAQYPQIDVVEDVLYVEDGNIITSAGSAAGIDAALHIVRQDFGSSIANKIARRLVMSPHRDGGQAQFVAAPEPLRAGQSMGTVMQWARGNICKPISLSDMASLAGMSERTFQRRFRNEIGVAPIAWLHRERMFRAQEMLEITNSPLPQIAEECGYESLDTFRVAFRRNVGTSPIAYRERFQQLT